LTLDHRFCKSQREFIAVFAHEEVKMGPVKIDDIDRRLMQLLREDGRRPYRTLAEAVGLSETAVRHRVARLTRARVIKNTIMTDPVKLGMLTAQVHVRVGGRPVRDVARAIAALPETDVVAIATGRYAVTADLICDSNDHLARVLNDVSAIDGVFDVDTHLYLETIKQTLNW
jgi:Lrp/AsnC family transcriptional regulator, regulator for asnA, asnC and gidA